ncbi:MAG TPA: Fur family transcriptional regulator [Acidimicrobiales bacterium]|nr:Fur family transcriptional regulator [Acidimicrobiales bacterium]
MSNVVAGALPPPGPPASIDEALALVRARGGRVTAPRRLLLEALFTSPAHRSAEDLAAEVQAVAPDVHLSTIYRNLEELERLGVVVHSHFGHGAATYHLAGTAHAHFLCEHCGDAIEAPVGVLGPFVAAAERTLGFRVDPFHFAIPGRCAACASAPPPPAV